MGKVYEICGDDSWTHCNLPLNRYWCFYTGLLMSPTEADRLETALHKIKQAHGFKLEIKWSNVSPEWLDFYKELANDLFLRVANNDIKLRQIFCDRSFEYIPEPGEPPATHLDIQFKICYQFLKYCFGIEFLPRAIDSADKIIIRLDDHSSKIHKKQLKEFVEWLPVQMQRTDLEIDCSHLCSTKLFRVQICDVLGGAAASYGNRDHLKRIKGRTRMSSYQKCRLDLSMHIYKKMRELNCLDRQKKDFNWFNSTSVDGHESNRLKHKIRIWKFRPNKHRIDKSWLNENREYSGGKGDLTKSVENPF
jgi:hypothetical protein